MRNKHHHQQHQTPSPLSATTSVSVLLLLLLCGATTPYTAQGDSINGDIEETADILERVLMSLERMTAFFGQDYSSVNVDGLFGIRVGQGSVNQTVTECRSSKFHCPQELLQRLHKLNGVINDIAEHAMPYVQAQDPDYFRHFRSTIDGPYILHYTTEEIRQFPAPSRKREPYDEDKGDKCLSSLMGLWENEPKCSISDECWRFMTEENTRGYTLTHQLLYFIVGDMNDCIPAIEKRLRSIRGDHSLRAHETRLCAHVLADARHEVKQHSVSTMKQDLFMEQSLLCGILGYQNFMTKEWTRMVLSWQNDNGCFSISPSLTAVESEIVKLQGEERKLMSLMKKEAENIDSHVTGRKLLREKVMEGNCLAHKTGLAFGLVGAYIRHFVRLLYAPPDLHN